MASIKKARRSRCALPCLNRSWLMMESRVVNQIEEFYRQDAKFTERNEES
jgi:hypothetical protein